MFHHSPFAVNRHSALSAPAVPVTTIATVTAVHPRWRVRKLRNGGYVGIRREYR